MEGSDAAMVLDEKVVDELIKGKTTDEVFGKEGVLKQLVKAMTERMMEAEMTHHVGYTKHEATGRNGQNSRNGHYSKTIQGEYGEATIKVPRDREGSFEPVVVAKGQKRFSGFDEKIVSMYALGMTTRDIQAHLQELYGVEVSPTLISQVTDTVLDEVKLWQQRPLDALYPIVYFDVLFIKVREHGHIRNKAVYVALGVNVDGYKELLGLWLSQTEGAKFWLSVFNELKTRGVKDIFIACVDGLKGFPEAIEAVFSQTEVQLCIVHWVRNSLALVSWKDRKAVAKDLRAIYSAATIDDALLALDSFEKRWDHRYPSIGKSWRHNWDRLTPFFAYPDDIRKAIYTTNAIESLNRSIRKVTKNRGAFPTDDAAMKLMYLALNNASKKWTMPIPHWKRALNQFAIMFEGRLPFTQLS